jgi:transcriptional regulator with XRE-family HTH domain
MAKTRTSSAGKGSFPRPGDCVKGRIIAAGIKLCDLARAAGMAKNTLSDYISGKIRSKQGQFNVWMAFVDLTGSQVSMDQFWGALSAREVA